MSSTMKNRIIQSIAVAIDCSPHSKASLEAAAEMAARLKAELIGIFVEDINLLRVAGLPFAEEVRLYSATTTKLDAGELERLLRQQAKQARELLQRTAEARTLRHTFRVLRGMVPEQLMQGAPEADITNPPRRTSWATSSTPRKWAHSSPTSPSSSRAPCTAPTAAT